MIIPCVFKNYPEYSPKFNYENYCGDSIYIFEYIVSFFSKYYYFLLEEPKKSKKKSKSKTLGELQEEGEFHIKPSTEEPELHDSQWPLLMKVVYF